MNSSLRLSNSCVRFRDSSADNFARGGRSILISLMSFSLFTISRLQKREVGFLSDCTTRRAAEGSRDTQDRTEAEPTKCWPGCYPAGNHPSVRAVEKNPNGIGGRSS